MIIHNTVNPSKISQVQPGQNPLSVVAHDTHHHPNLMFIAETMVSFGHIP
jgi:hypothetical protein